MDENLKVKKQSRPTQAETVASAPQQQPKVVYKDQQGFRHDLFKLKDEKLLKNQSFKKGQVKLESFSHTHFFHTYDSNGRQQQYSTSVGGHFHEVKWKVDANGELVAECGPALRNVYHKRGGRQKKFIEPVKWYNENSDSAEGEWVKDSHTHEVEYRWSEELSVGLVRQRRNAQERMVQSQIQDAAHARALGLESGLD